MPDTLRGDFSNQHCGDCGKKGCTFYHFGPLVPPGKTMFFCDDCWAKRTNFFYRNDLPMPAKELTP